MAAPTPAAAPATEAAVLRDRIVGLAQDASIEITPEDEPLVRRLAQCLRAGTRVQVAHTPVASLEDVIRVALLARQEGLCAIPHIVARRVSCEAVARSALQQLRRGGIGEIFLVAGDNNQAAGEFDSSMEVLATGMTVDAGITAIGVAGHPLGHRAIGPQRLWDALQRKQAFAERTGTRMHIVTQFNLEAAAIGAWETELVRHGVNLPVRAGIAGPTPFAKLYQYALQGGVGSSLHSVMNSLSSMDHFAGLSVTPDEHLLAIARAAGQGGARRIIAPHFFTLGGTLATARWLRCLMDGAFAVDPATGRLAI